MYKTLIVVDHEEQALSQQFSDVITFDTYLNDYPKFNEPKTRIINLCDTENYLSKGYYCSLLAEARRHVVLPSVKTINELRHFSQTGQSTIDLKQAEKQLLAVQASGSIISYFGSCDVPELNTLTRSLFDKYAAPILKLSIDKPIDTNLNSTEDNKLELNQTLLRVERLAFADLDSIQKARLLHYLTEFTQTVWRMGKRVKHYRWDMAILINPNEKVPPSNKEAISRFIKAAEKQGIRAKALTKDELIDIAYYDALFIRETTAIDHYTYQLANSAEKNGLVVIDDATSILRCCNKVYLHDAFNYQKVPSLKTSVISDSAEVSLDRLESDFGYPLILKMPEGSFSIGVYKINDRQELINKLNEMFKHSALVLAQEYLYTEFDWRIGVLNGRAIYACRYMMARNHWQIYNHNAKRFFSGDFETLATFEVPKIVLDAALRAAKVVGNGLYGVDIKHHNNNAYVLEVNDNPSIDHKIEDAYLGNELYMEIMAEFQRRLELRGR